MPEVHRDDDCNTAGGCVNSIPQSTVFINNKLAVVDGSLGTGHPPCPTPVIHCEHVWETANGSETVFIENIPVNDKNDADTCGHPRAEGSPDVFTHGT